MCGIIGYTGIKQVLPKLFGGLTSLEYRGYDSAGICINDTHAGIICLKKKGRVSGIRELVAEYEQQVQKIDAYCGIGHTRWATHGKPSDINAHPYCTDILSIVHNGIIENYADIKVKLTEKGYRFQSETDTEVAANLFDFFYRKLSDPIMTIREATKYIQGSYAFGIIYHDRPAELYAIRKDSPLILAAGEDGYYIASDIPAILQFTDQYYRLEENQIAILTTQAATIINNQGIAETPNFSKVTWNIHAAEKNGYEHFMLKEIHEEPLAVQNTLTSVLSSEIETLLMQKEFDIIHIVACGTAMHAGLIGKYLIEKFAKIPVNVYIASEFRYQNPIIKKHDLVIFISQSGETADTLAALRLAKEREANTLAIVNVAGSTIAREADHVIMTLAGPEISVASTKAYSSQITVMYGVAFKLAIQKGSFPARQIQELLAELSDKVPQAISKVLAEKSTLKKLAQEFIQCQSTFYIGRGLDFYIATEGSLKMKEISYIHSEAYAAGEMKHGTISLIGEGTPVIAIATCKTLFEKTISNIKEVKARGAKVILLCTENKIHDTSAFDFVIRLPELNEIFSPFTSITALQLLAYYTTVLRGCDVDRPRNLAKSVTVE